MSARSSHSIFTRDLKRHLKICPKAKQAAVEAQLPCFRRNCNVDETCAQVENPSYALEKGSTLRTSRVLCRLWSEFCH